MNKPSNITFYMGLFRYWDLTSSFDHCVNCVQNFFTYISVEGHVGVSCVYSRVVFTSKNCPAENRFKA